MAVFTVLQMEAKILQNPYFAVVFALVSPGNQKSTSARTLLIFALRAKHHKFLDIWLYHKFAHLHHNYPYLQGEQI